MDDALSRLIERVRTAFAECSPLCIRAGGTKDFYGQELHGDILDPRELQGIVAYEPTELVITARAGTSLGTIESVLAAQNQMLAFEPPHFGAEATVGGCVAAGLAGPRRASFGTAYGSVRDFMLGVRLLDGRGHILTFGGTVMKNVAGYDVARVLAGSLGILGVITEVSLKVLPRPAAEATVRFEMDQVEALDALNVWSGKPLPISASAWCDGLLSLRLSGPDSAISAAHVTLGGELIQQTKADRFWSGVREQADAFFSGSTALWRVSLPSTAAPLNPAGPEMIEWGGALRWIRSAQPAREIRTRAQQLGGHATLFRSGDRSEDVFTPLTATVATIHRRLKAAFDPSGILNRRRMFKDL